MYELMNVPIPDVTGYLKRLGMDEAPAANPEGLNALIWAHQTTVPFEDLNTSLLKRPVSLEIPALYEKIVEKRRGGYCFELNALFARLLLDLGFDAHQVFCRVVRGRDFLPPCLHEGIAVTIDNRKYFCDVGFGGPMPGGALPIEDGWSGEIHGDAFRIDRFDENWWTMFRRTSGGEWERVLQFNTFPQIPQEFLTVNYRCASDPDSIFVKQVLVNLRTEDGALSVTDDRFTLRAGGEARTEIIADEAALRVILLKHFGISLPA